MARRNQDRGQKMYTDAPASETEWDKVSPPRSGGAASPRRDIISLRAPAPAPAPQSERPAQVPEKTEPPAEKTDRPSGPSEQEAKPDQQPASKEEKPSGKPSKGFLRRHPLLAGVGLIALVLAGAAGYVYWDNSSHFKSTDDAFIAARQFAIAPKIAGYVVAVPVTDNQHVNKGDVIAKIDQRDYLTALAQSQAQVAGAEAAIHNVDTQISNSRGADRRRSSTGEPGAGEHGACTGHLGTRPTARQQGLGDRSAGHHGRPEPESSAGDC